MSDRDSYEVGYGKPPKSGQFKKGKSGNPKGRPKGRKSMQDHVQDILQKKVTVTINGKAQKISAFEAVLQRIMRDCLKGDARATEQLLRLAQYGQEDSTSTAGATPSQADDIALLDELKHMMGTDGSPTSAGSNDD